MDSLLSASGVARSSFRLLLLVFVDVEGCSGGVTARWNGPLIPDFYPPHGIIGGVHLCNRRGADDADARAALSALWPRMSSTNVSCEACHSSLVQVLLSFLGDITAHEQPQP